VGNELEMRMRLPRRFCEHGAVLANIVQAGDGMCEIGRTPQALLCWLIWRSDQWTGSRKDWATNVVQVRKRSADAAIRNTVAEL